MRILQLTEMADFYNYFLFSIVTLIAEGNAGESPSGSGMLPEYMASPDESQLHPSQVSVSLSPPEEVLREGRCFLACVLDEVSDLSDIIYIIPSGS